MVETLHVHNVHEDPSRDTLRNVSRAVFKAAPSLSELSLWIHQGGGSVWGSFLHRPEQTVPNLRRFGVAQVTYLHLEELEDSSDEYCCIYCDGPKPCTVVETCLELGQIRNVLPQLDVLATECPINTRTSLKLRHDDSLAIILDHGHQYLGVTS